MRSKISLSVVAFLLLGAAAVRADDDDPAKGKFTIEEATKGLTGSGPLTAKIETTLGTFTCELFEKEAPITVANFVGLARGLRPWKDPKTGQWVKKPFYDGLIFHRVIPGFMIQGGDPLGLGTGNPGYRFTDEFSPQLTFDKPALLAMANAGPGTNGSQFFITEGTPAHLNNRHTIFGKCEPVSLVSKITSVERGPRDKPVKDVVMKKVTISRGKGGKGEVGGQVKHFVLDTNVLIHDPRAILQFADNEVVIPIFVLEEVDQFKKEASERGRNAREVARMLDELRADGHRLSEGAPLPSGGRIKVASAARSVPTTLRESQIADHLILMVALDVRDANKGEPTIFVTKDVNLRIRADALGLTSTDFEGEHIDIDELYSGMTELPVPGTDVDTFYAQNTLPLLETNLKANQYVLLRDRDNPSHSALGRFDAAAKRLVPLRKLRDGVWGIRPRNKEQHCALDLLLCDEVKLVTLIGKAGTGKTMLALAAGLQKVVEEQLYSKMLVSRPIFPLGRDVGFLPGDIEQKLNPWMQPIYDNVEFLMGLSKTERKNGRSYQELIDMGYIEIEPLTYIRGRSIPNQFIIVDEAQNLTPHEVKTIITRVGEATKVVLTGDPYQIDNPYVDATSNGLTTVVEKFKGEHVAGHVTLSKGERSPLAELASNVL